MEVVDNKLKETNNNQLKQGPRNKMFTATTHAHNGNLKLMLNLTGYQHKHAATEKQEIPF